MKNNILEIKPQDFGFFNLVKHIIGEKEAIKELNLVIKSGNRVDVLDEQGRHVALDEAFIWAETPQGLEFWAKIYDYIDPYKDNKNEILVYAKTLYYKHLGYNQDHCPYLWDQASEEYQSAWITIARLEIEDEQRIHDAVLHESR